MGLNPALRQMCLEFFNMPNDNKVTSDEAAAAASRVLRDKKASKDSKTAAGSALSQHESDDEKKAKDKDGDK